MYHFRNANRHGVVAKKLRSNDIGEAKKRTIRTNENAVEWNRQVEVKLPLRSVISEKV